LTHIYTEAHFSAAGRARAVAWQYQQSFEHEKEKKPWDDVAQNYEADGSERPSKKHKKDARPLPAEEKQTTWGEWTAGKAGDGVSF